MAEETKPFRCSVCDILRERDTNHWWVIRLRPRGNGSVIELAPWNSVLARRDGSALVCGLNCLMTASGRAAEAIVGMQIITIEERSNDAA